MNNEEHKAREEMVAYLDDALSLKGYTAYIDCNLGSAIDVAHHGGCLMDLDCIVELQELVGFTVSYELYQFINSKYDGSLLEVCEDKNNMNEIMAYCNEWMRVRHCETA